MYCRKISVGTVIIFPKEIVGGIPEKLPDEFQHKLPEGLSKDLPNKFWKNGRSIPEEISSEFLRNFAMELLLKYLIEHHDSENYYKIIGFFFFFKQ